MANNVLTGGGGRDVLTGDAGNDTLDGGAGDDRLVGGLGDDTLILGSGNNAADGGAGTDTVVLTGTRGDYLFSRPSAGTVVVTRRGGGETDTLVNVERVQFGDGQAGQLTASNLLGNTASSLDDTFVGSFDDDTFDGLAGNDQISGGAGSDTLRGGLGHDTLDGGSGADLLDGGLGNDTFVVDDAGDQVIEAAKGGTDLVKTQLAEYTLANDVEQLLTIGTEAFIGSGNALDNLITGGSQDDVLSGSSGNDTLRGMSGNDILNGGTGTDTMEGGAGDDLYIVDSTGDKVVEGVLVSSGNDTIRVSLATFSLATLGNVENLAYTGSANFAGTGNAADNIIRGGAGQDRLDGGAGNDLLEGSSGNDTLTGGVGTDTLVLAGNRSDYLFSRPTATTVLVTRRITGEVDTLTGIEQVQFGDGVVAQLTLNDLLLNTASAFDDTYTGGEGDDAFDGLAGNDQIAGGSGNDTLRGGVGNDTLDGGIGDDQMDGGAGNDTFVVDSVNDQVVELANGGTDLVKTTLSVYTLAAGVENLLYTGQGTFAGTGNGLNNGITGGSSDDFLSGLAGNDTLRGMAGHDTLDGGEGADTLEGGVGNDLYLVDSVGDKVVEWSNEGNDTVRVNLATFSLATLGHVENLAYSGAVNFTGTGNALDNILQGGAGRDKLDGGAGNDILEGGAGNDSLTGGMGIDTVGLAGRRSDYLFSRPTATTVMVTNRTTDEVDTLAGIELVRFGDGEVAQLSMSDLLANTASAFDDVYAGGDGDDTFDGLAGNDQISGGLGQDTLRGGAGNDVLDGGIGDDLMDGGAGNDTFVVDSVSDQVVELANGGTDLVKTTLSAHTLAAGVENLLYTGQGTFAGTGNDLNNGITGGSGNDLLSGQAGNDILQGMAGNDILDGGSGNNILDGGFGDDTFIVNSVGDRVVERDYEGIDTVRTSMVSFSLATLGNIENLAYTGSANFVGTGNAADNLITGGMGQDKLSGGAGNDTLKGGTGADILTGGAGSDQFYFTAPEDGEDTVTDFNAAENDQLVFVSPNFGNIPVGGLVASAFVANETGVAATAEQRFVFNTATGRLSYDTDGSGSMAAVSIANLNVRSLSAGQIKMVAG